MDTNQEKNGKVGNLSGGSILESVGEDRVCWKCGEVYDDSHTVCPVDGVSLVSIGGESANDPHIGKLFDDRYLITRKLGEGGMGIVYAARQVDFDREVAIKILRMSYVGNSDVRRRFMYEARTISNLRHPNAVRLYDFGQTSGGNVYMVMELLVGESLADRLTSQFVSYKQIFNMLIPICGVLAEAHNNGVIHRDLKPENIYIGKIDGQPEFYKLLDFGIAKHLKSNLLTQSGILWGTPAYMSPEQIMGEQVSSATDIYAVGVILYELISGRLPFNSDSPVAIAMKHLTSPVRSLQSIPGLHSVPEPLDHLILSALNKEPDKRPESMETFVELLSSIRTEYFSESLLEVIPPYEIDAKAYEEWIENEPKVAQETSLQGNDIYSLSKSISNYSRDPHPSNPELGNERRVSIPTPQKPPEMGDIVREENKTNIFWNTREEQDSAETNIGIGQRELADEIAATERVHKDQLFDHEKELGTLNLEKVVKSGVPLEHPHNLPGFRKPKRSTSLDLATGNIVTNLVVDEHGVSLPVDEDGEEEHSTAKKNEQIAPQRTESPIVETYQNPSSTPPNIEKSRRNAIFIGLGSIVVIAMFFIIYSVFYEMGEKPKPTPQEPQAVAKKNTDDNPIAAAEPKPLKESAPPQINDADGASHTQEEPVLSNVELAQLSAGRDAAVRNAVVLGVSMTRKAAGIVEKINKIENVAANPSPKSRRKSGTRRKKRRVTEHTRKLLQGTF